MPHPESTKSFSYAGEVAENASRVFGIQSRSGSNSVVYCRQLNAKNTETAKRMANVSKGYELSPYTCAILCSMADRASEQGEVVPVRHYYHSILTLEGFNRPKYQTDVEDSIKRISRNIVCCGTTDVVRDTAAMMTLAEMCAVLAADETKRFTDQQTCDSVCYHLCRLGVECKVCSEEDKSAIESARAAGAGLDGSESVDGDNNKNIVIALLKLGKIQDQMSAEEKNIAGIVLYNANISGGVVSVDDLKNELQGKGIIPNAGMIGIINMAAQAAGINLGTRWPVDVEWAPFAHGVGLSHGNLGYGDVPDPPPPAGSKTPSSLPEEKSGSGSGVDYGAAINQILTGVIKIGTKYGEGFVDNLNYETDAKIKIQMQQAGIPVTDSKSVAAWAEKNPFEAGKAAQNAAKELGMSKEDIAKMMEDAKSEMMKDAKSDNTQLYIVLGVAGVLVLGLGAVALSRGGSDKESRRDREDREDRRDREYRKDRERDTERGRNREG